MNKEGPATREGPKDNRRAVDKLMEMIEKANSPSTAMGQQEPEPKPKENKEQNESSPNARALKKLDEATKLFARYVALRNGVKEADLNPAPGAVERIGEKAGRLRTFAMNSVAMSLAQMTGITLADKLISTGFDRFALPAYIAPVIFGSVLTLKNQLKANRASVARGAVRNFRENMKANPKKIDEALETIKKAPAFEQSPKERRKEAYGELKRFAPIRAFEAWSNGILKEHKRAERLFKEHKPGLAKEFLQFVATQALGVAGGVAGSIAVLGTGSAIFQPGKYVSVDSVDKGFLLQFDYNKFIDLSKNLGIEHVKNIFSVLWKTVLNKPG